MTTSDLALHVGAPVFRVRPLRAALAAVTALGLVLASAALAADGPAYRYDLRPTAVARVAGPGAPIDVFQYDTRFTKQTTAGNAEPDLDQVLVGTRSLRVTTDGDAQQVNVRAVNLRPIDLRGSFLRLNLRVRGLEHLDYLSNDGFETYDAFPILVGAGDPLYAHSEEGEWFTVTANLGRTAAGAAPKIDLSVVTDVQLSFRDDGSAPVTTWLDALSAVAAPPRGKVSLVFDDARDGVFHFALPLAQQLGLRASIAAIVELVGEPTFMTLEQLKVAERFAGWEVIAHQTSLLENGGFDTLGPAELAHELTGVKSWLLDNGFHRGADLIAYPYGGYDAASVEAVRRYFAAGRTIVRSQGLETWPPADPYRIRAVSVAATDTPGAINALVDRAAAEHSWLVLVFHQVYPRGSDVDTYYYTEDLASIYAHLAAADVDVVLLSEALFER